MTLSLAFGLPLRLVGQVLTSQDWAAYQAADREGLIPDWKTFVRLQAAVAGIDIDAEQPTDLMAGYKMRKAMYGGR